ncbi:MAG: gamma-glutamyl-gamma-aminobutyrate hydrolase family protein [Bacillota bacterium]
MSRFLSKAVIGLTCSEDGGDNVCLSKHYHRSVERAGGIPLLVPPVEAAIADYLAMFDGFILSGGVDVDPLYFHEEPVQGMGEIMPERDSFEIKLVQQAFAADLPLLVICRGLQVLNIALGGNIYQDIYSQMSGAIKHCQQAPRWYPTHSVSIKGNSVLKKVFSHEVVLVNSFHHQGVKILAPGLEAAAFSSDGLVEAVWAPEKEFVLGVQWHPECMVERYREQQEIFNVFIKACVKSKKQE